MINTVDKGVSYFTESFGGSHDGTFSYNDKKLIFTGQFRITKMLNSYKYGDQLQFQILSLKGDARAKIKVRNDSKWNNVEINLPLSMIDEIIASLIKLREKKNVES